MQALRFEQFGEPDKVLKLVDIAEPPLAPGDVRVRVEAAAINPSDLVNARGKFPQTTLPRTIGRDFAGTVVEGPKELIGVPIWGSGADIGYTRDGAHAEYLHIPAAAAVRRPANLSPEQAAAVGVPYITAWSALELAQVHAHGSVIVSGAVGAVGGAVLELLHVRGQRAIALVLDPTQASQLDPARVAAVANSADDNLVQVVRDATAGRGVDAALNGIGASAFQLFLSVLAKGGRMVVYSVLYGGKDAALDLFALYRNRHQILGLDTAVIGVAAGAKILAQLLPLFESGALPAPHITATFPLRDAFAAYHHAATAPGKVVLRMNSHP